MPPRTLSKATAKQPVARRWSSTESVRTEFLDAARAVFAKRGYTDASVTKGDTSIRTGSSLPNVARHSGNLLLTRTFRAGGGDAVTVGAGLNYVGERLGDVAVSGSFRLPAYATARLLAAYAPTPRLRLALNLDNLFDRAYYASAYSQLWVAPGAERTITATLSYPF